MKQLLPILFCLGLIQCTSLKKVSPIKHLLPYEGQYEYFNNTTLTLAASGMDTTLYAVLDGAKYPLTYISTDTFANIGDVPVIFQRDESGNIQSYQVSGSTFKRNHTDIGNIEMYPRKSLFGQPEDFVYVPPKKMDDGLAVGDLEQVFTKPELVLEMVQETIAGSYPDVHSILIFKEGKLVLEEYFYGYDEAQAHQLRSASKSFLGGLVGIAIEQGAIKSEQDLLLPYFQNSYRSIDYSDKRKDKITIEDFLTYRHGMDCDDENQESRGNELSMMKSEDWVKFILDLPMEKESGQESSYCTGCPTVLGRLVELATDTPIVDYADKYLFDPMGIKEYQWRFAPDPSSANTFNQMYLRPRDLVKLSKMYLDKGQWQGKQILPAEWVQKTFHQEDPEFGYLWRHKYFELNGVKYNSYLATGNGGQKINIWPELDMITVFTGGNYNSYLLYGRSTPPNEMIPKYILSAL